MEGVIGSVLIYPYCGLGARSRYAGWATSEPSLLVVAEEDTVALTRPAAFRENGDE